MELKSQSSPSAAKSKFSIDSILQQKTAAAPATTQQPAAWRNAAPEARMMHLQQQQQKAALVIQQRNQQERSNQHLIQFILNAGQPFHSILALGSNINSSRQSMAPGSSAAANITSASPNITTSRSLAAPIPACTQTPPQHGHPKQTGPRAASGFHVEQANRTRSPPSLLQLDRSDSDIGSPRRRQSSVNSTGISNDSDEDHDAVMKTVITSEHPLLSSHTPPYAYPNAKISAPQAHSSREIAFKKSRTSFTKAQIQKLEVKFSEQKYLTKLDRIQLARELGLTEKHVKTWFQNRRTKWKKDCSDVDWSKHKEMAATLMYNQYLENKSQRTDQEGSISS